MIALIRGVVRAKVGTRSIIVDVGGVGYLVQVPSELVLMSIIGTEIEVFCVTVIREESMTLFGFSTLSERNFFEALLGVRLIGPSLAMLIVSTLLVDDLIDAVQTKSTHVLTSLPGVGEKTANRILVELDSKIAVIRSAVGEESSVGVRRVTASASIKSEVEGALLSLGFDAREVKLALSKIEEMSTVEDTIRSALAELSR